MHILKRCPRDKAKLICLAGQYVSAVVDWALYYCPKCDCAITETGESPSHINFWKRVSATTFEPFREKEPPPAHAGAIRKLRGTIPATVQRWLAERHSEPGHCPNDGSRIPRLAELKHGDRCSVVYLWCPRCSMGFAFINDPDYGWEYHVAFNRKATGYEVTKDYLVGGARQYRHEWLGEVTAEPLDLPAEGASD